MMWKPKFIVLFWRYGAWNISAGRHSSRRTAVISQQWWEYVAGFPAVVEPPAPRREEGETR